MTSVVREGDVGVYVETYMRALYNSETGKWSVYDKVTQKRTSDPTLEDWEEKMIDVTTVNESLEEALAEALITLDFYMESVKGDLFADTSTEEKLDA